MRERWERRKGRTFRDGTGSKDGLVLLCGVLLSQGSEVVAGLVPGEERPGISVVWILICSYQKSCVRARSRSRAKAEEQTREGNDSQNSRRDLSYAFSTYMYGIR